MYLYICVCMCVCVCVCVCMNIYMYAHRHSSVPARRTRVIDTAALVSGRFLDDKKHRWLGFEKAQKLALDTGETGTLLA